MREHKTTLDFAGRSYPALVRYECATGDGWPLIEEVWLKREEEQYQEGKGIVSVVISGEVTQWLDDSQLKTIESEIDCALKEAVTDNRIERWAIERKEFMWSVA